MIARLISFTSKIRADRRLAALGMTAFVLLASGFLVVSYFAYKFAILAPSTADSAQFAAMVFAPSIVGLFFAAVLMLGLAALAVARESFAAPLRDLQTCLQEALRDPAGASKLTLPNSQAGELGEVIGAANALFGLISASQDRESGCVEPQSPGAAPSVIRHLPDAAIAWDETGSIVEANQVAATLCGFETVEELKASSEAPGFAISPDTPPRDIADCLTEGPFSRDAVLVGKEGQRTPIHLRAVRLPETGDFPARYLATMTDETERHGAQAKLEAGNRALLTSNRAKSGFMASMSHEARASLNAIAGSAETLTNQPFGPLGSPQYLDYAADIRARSAHLAAFLNDVEDLCSIDAGRLEPQESTIPVRGLIDSCTRFMQETAAGAGVTLAVKLAEDLPDLQADERLATQMLVKLLSNGIQSTPAGGTVSVTAQLKAGALLIAVADSGAGMSREEALAALEPFRRTGPTDGQQPQGAGLGLPLVKASIELHDGGFRLDSGPGKGTAVTLTFPPNRVLSSDGERSVA